jgi:deferrochelatase/peroxidase EfeB
MRRRAFLGGVAAGALGAAGCAAQSPRGPRDPSTTDRAQPVLPPGLGQPGIVTPPPATAMLAALDLKASDPGQVARVLQRLTARLRVLPDSTPDRSRLTVTVAVGAGFFADHLGLAALSPRRLTAMPSFPSDVLDRRSCHGDLLLQVCAEQPATVRAALRQLLHDTSTRLQRRWSIAGFRPENQVTATGVAITRNLFGFREGAGNPDPDDQALMNELVWVQPGGDEPAWTVGGTYQVVRLIRFATELWDAESVEQQEDVFGRHKQTGAPLAGKREDQAPNFAVDPNGRITPLDAHIRRANPHAPETEASRILRRSYSYRRGRDAAGQPDEGLIFVCFQQDLERGFATVQRRLRGEALERYVLPFGGGYFFVLPAAPPGGYLGQQLLEAAD